MNDNTRGDAIYWPISLNNEATPDASIFAGAAPAPTSTVIASIIVPEAHIPPLGQKQHTKTFSPVHMKKMAKKDTIDTTPAPDALTAALADTSAQSPGLTVSNSRIHWEIEIFPPAPSAPKTQKEEKKKNYDKVNSY